MRFSVVGTLVVLLHFFVVSFSTQQTLRLPLSWR